MAEKVSMKEYAFREACAELLSANLSKTYRVQDDDPMVDFAKAIDRIQEIKDSIPHAVMESLDFVTTRLSTQFELVSKPILQALPVQQAQLEALSDRVGSVDDRLARMGQKFNQRRDPLVKPEWKNIATTTAIFFLAIVTGYNYWLYSRSMAWAESKTGIIAKQIVDRNPKLVESCRKLTEKDRKALVKMQTVPTKICSAFL